MRKLKIEIEGYNSLSIEVKYYDKKYVNKKERERHLPDYYQKTLQESAGRDERR